MDICIVEATSHVHSSPINKIEMIGQLPKVYHENNSMYQRLNLDRLLWNEVDGGVLLYILGTSPYDIPR